MARKGNIVCLCLNRSRQGDSYFTDNAFAGRVAHLCRTEQGALRKIYLDGKKYRGEIALSSSGANIRHLGEYQRKSEAADAVQNLLLELSQPGARSYF